MMWAAGTRRTSTGRFRVFGRKSRAERLKEQAGSNSLVPLATLSAAYAGAKPLAERLLYDDDLRDNIRVFIESARSILDEISDEEPTEIITRLWADDKLRKQVEAAAGAARGGSKRVGGQEVCGGGGGGAAGPASTSLLARSARLLALSLGMPKRASRSAFSASRSARSKRVAWA